MASEFTASIVRFTGILRLPPVSRYSAMSAVRLLPDRHLMHDTVTGLSQAAIHPT
jgi:hypothetical protein